MRFLSSRTAVAGVTLLAAAGIAAAGPATASASPARSAAATDCTTGVPTGSGTLGLGGSSWAEWESNPCGELLQERTWCNFPNGPGTAYWATSGVVKAVKLLDASYCSGGASAARGEWRMSPDGGATWTTYVTFFPS